MSLQSILKRRLSLEGCRKVGTQAQQLLQSPASAPHVNALPDELKAELAAVQTQTNAFDAIHNKEPAMGHIDNATDQCLGGYHGQLVRRERCFTYPELLALSPEEEAHLRRSEALRRHLFPEGIDFIREPSHIEWNRLHELQTRLAAPAVKEDLAYLGMTIETQRLLRWIERYGARLGITQALPEASDPKAIAVSSWHEAWESLTLEARYTLRRKASAEFAPLLTEVLALFDQQHALEAELARKQRERHLTAEATPEE